MRYLIIIFLCFFCFNSVGQTLPIKDLVSIYKKDSSQLQIYFDSINYTYLKFYGDKSLRFGDTENHMERWFTDSNKINKHSISSIGDVYPILFYRFSNIQEFNECKINILEQGFILDSIRTSQLNTNVGDSIECYILNGVEIQLSDNDFKDNIKLVNGTYPMSAFSGQDVHMYSAILGSKWK